MTKCKACGKEIIEKAVICPHCGAKVKKPFYKKFWFWFLILIAVIIFSGKGSDTPKDEIITNAPIANVEYRKIVITKLLDDLSANALKAETEYQNAYIETTGYIDVIDSDGSYFSIDVGGSDLEYLFEDITCYIENEEQLNFLLTKNVGDKVTVKGQITDIGEILGYNMELHSIE